MEGWRRSGRAGRGSGEEAKRRRRRKRGGQGENAMVADECLQRREGDEGRGGRNKKDDKSQTHKLIYFDDTFVFLTSS